MLCMVAQCSPIHDGRQNGISAMQVGLLDYLADKHCSCSCCNGIRQAGAYMLARDRQCMHFLAGLLHNPMWCLGALLQLLKHLVGLQSPPHARKKNARGPKNC